MEGSIGFFGQIKYVCKGIAKPKYFNRLSNQSKPAFIFYTIFMAIVSAAVFWGITYLFVMGIGNGGKFNQVKKVVEDNVPQFSYQNGVVEFEETSYFHLNDKYSFIFDSTVDKMNKEYLEKAQILVDWQNGKEVFVFNGKEVTHIKVLGGTDSFAYTMIAKPLSIPSSFDKEGFIKIAKEKFPMVYLIIAGISVIGFIFKAFITGVIFGFVGLGMAKIVKLPWPYAELYRVALYVTGWTTILKSALSALPVVGDHYIILSIVFLLIGSVYMFFAITGSSEDAGPTSTVVFNKPGSKKSLGEIEPPDPFSRKTFGSAEYAQKTSFAPKTPEPVQSSPVPSAPAVAATAAAATATTFTTKSETPSYSAPSYSTPTYETQSVPETTYEQPVEEPVYETAQTEEYVAESYTQQEDTTYYTQSSEVPYEQVTEPSYAETAYAESPAEEPALDNTSFYDMSATTAAPEESPAIVKSDLTYGGGVSMFSSVGSGPKKKEKYARPITAPDAYNGLYYSGSDSEESYESNYGSGSLLDRGGLYGKTIGGTTSDNPFSNVLSGTAPSTSAFGSSLGSHSTFAPGSESSGTYGGSLFHKDAAPSQESASSSGHLTFTTKGGSTPFANGSYMSAPPSADYKGPSTTKKGGKTLNRYSADDFAAWERENYADDFKPRGGFGNNIF